MKFKLYSPGELNTSHIPPFQGRKTIDVFKYLWGGDILVPRRVFTF